MHTHTCFSISLTKPGFRITVLPSQNSKKTLLSCEKKQRETGHKLVIVLILRKVDTFVLPKEPSLFHRHLASDWWEFAAVGSFSEKLI